MARRINIETRRKEIFDPAWEEYVDEELPTMMIKEARMDTGTINGSALVQRTFGAGTVCRITHLRVNSSAAHWFYVKDRSGTIDFLYLQSAGEIESLGGPMDPIYSVQGTFKILSYGSYSAGTRTASFAGIIRFQGTETRPG